MAGRVYNYSDIPTNSEYGEILEFRDWIVTILDLITRMKGTETPFDQNKCTLDEIIGYGSITDKFLSMIEIGDSIFAIEQFESTLMDKMNEIERNLSILSSSVNMLNQSLNTTNTNVSANTSAITNIKNTISDIQSVLDGLSGSQQSITNNINSLWDNVNTMKTDITNIKNNITSINNKFNDYILGSTNAKKIVCSTSNPSNGDGNPNGTIWFVYWN